METDYIQLVKYLSLESRSSFLWRCSSVILIFDVESFYKYTVCSWCLTFYMITDSELLPLCTTVHVHSGISHATGSER